ncbi:inositol monophosphatase [Candidatus Saccharibacteria bacterium]|nr:inositol monophosphatase [Candidatus Saccharibacteria bacterium]
MTAKTLTEYKEFGLMMAREAGAIMRKYSQIDQEVERKSDNTPVTIADKTINTLLIEHVKMTFPEHGVLGEEESYEPSRKILWVCDPIDGTVSYILHSPHSMFSLAYVEDGTVLVAVTYNPWTDELFCAAKGEGAALNGEQISVSGRKWGEEARIVSTSDPMHKPYPTDSPESILKIRSEGNRLFHLSGGVFKGMLVAQGYADGFTFPYTSTHDIAAIKLIVEEAGGKVTNLSGHEQRYDEPINGAIVSNGKIHKELTDIVSDYAYSGD